MTDEEILALYEALDDTFEEWHEFEVAFARAIESRVREECAKVCERHIGKFNHASENADRYIIQDEWSVKCAAAIRQLGGKS